MKRENVEGWSDTPRKRSSILVDHAVNDETLQWSVSKETPKRERRSSGRQKEVTKSQDSVADCERNLKNG